MYVRPDISSVGVGYLVREYRRLFGNSMHPDADDFMADVAFSQAEALERIIHGFQLDPRECRHRDPGERPLFPPGNGTRLMR